MVLTKYKILAQERIELYYGCWDSLAPFRTVMTSYDKGKILDEWYLREDIENCVKERDTEINHKYTYLFLVEVREDSKLGEVNGQVIDRMIIGEPEDD